MALVAKFALVRFKLGKTTDCLTHGVHADVLRRAPGLAYKRRHTADVKDLIELVEGW